MCFECIITKSYRLPPNILLDMATNFTYRQNTKNIRFSKNKMTDFYRTCDVTKPFQAKLNRCTCKYANKRFDLWSFSKTIKNNFRCPQTMTLGVNGLNVETTSLDPQMAQEKSTHY